VLSSGEQPLRQILASVANVRQKLIAFGVLTVLLAACYTPPPYVPPADLPSPTPVPAQATSTAALQSGPTATQVALTAATSIAQSPMRIIDVSLDPENAANSAVTVFNGGQAIVDLSGWALLVDNYRVTLPSNQYMSVGPGAKMILHLGNSQGPTSGQDIYVGISSVQSTPRGDAERTVLLFPNGSVASTYPPL
jgi:hypothetical protein